MDKFLSGPYTIYWTDVSKLYHDIDDHESSKCNGFHMISEIKDSGW